jgi:dienelactone hydrolase
MWCSLATRAAHSDETKQRAYLRQLQSVLPPERPDRGRVSPLDATWEEWLARTGELPPDFDDLPSLPFLPDPLVLNEGRENIPVTTMAQWQEKRVWMQKEIQHWITGTFPPRPDNLTARIVDERKDGAVIVRIVELQFGPERRAKMTVELYIPPGDGPFPVFMTPGGGGSSWIPISQAVQRDYLGCLYAGCDAKDDTDAYAEIWYPHYDFTRLMRRAWGAHRVVDYLHSLTFVDKDKIGLTGLSRDGKQSLMAAAFDERIKAVIPCSGGTGAEDPFRYTSDKFDNETITEITTNFPHWLHPRLRFFIGREHKLPVDQNLLTALVAPRGLLISSAITEDQGNPWGIEQNYLSVRPVYEFLAVENKIGLHLRHGYHSPAARDVEVYVDFFDYVFGRGEIPPPRQRYYDYSFAKWRGISRESINPLDYAAKGIDDLLVGPQGEEIKTVAAWELKKREIQRRVQWGLGDEPPTVSPGRQSDYLRDVIVQPRLSKSIGSQSILMGTLYYPVGGDGKPANDQLPVVIYLHEYAYPTGYARRPILQGFLDQGFAVYAWDQISFGTRIEEGTRFYERFPHWSKLGRTVTDLRWAVDALTDLDFIDAEHIYTVGYSLGGTVGLYAAALDERVAGVVSVCGFAPMRLATADKGTEGIRAFSHLHGLLPRLGFFVGQENHIPYDYHEILACIAPRPVLVIAPQWDRDATFADVKECVEETRQVYQLYKAEKQLEQFAPDDYNRFSTEMQTKVFEWLKSR